MAGWGAEFKRDFEEIISNLFRKKYYLIILKRLLEQ
jgi:hypothetical protein